MVGAPRPQIVDDDVVAIDFEARSGGPGDRAADAEEYIADRRRIAGVANSRSACHSNLEEHGRVDRTGIDEKPGHLHSAHVGHSDRAAVPVRAEPGPRGSRVSEHNRVRVGHVDRSRVLIDPWGQNQETILARSQRRVDTEPACLRAWAMKKVLIASEVPASRYRCCCWSSLGPRNWSSTWAKTPSNCLRCPDRGKAFRELPGLWLMRSQ